MTNLEQVKNLLSITGSGSDASITDWLIAGGRVIAELIPMDKASQFAVVETPAAISYDLTNKKFISINSTNGSHFISTTPDIFTRSSTVGSIYKTIADGNQCYTIDGDLLKVTVIANSLKTYTYPTVASENITNLPTEYIHGAVLYAASNAITKLLIDENYKVVYVPPILILNNIHALITASPLFAFDAAVTHAIPFPAISYQGSIITGPSAVDIASIVDLAQQFTGFTFTTPTISFSLNMESVVLPDNISTSILTDIASTDAAVNTVTLTTAITELNNYFGELDGGSGYINGLEDVELAQSKMNEIQIKLKEIETELGTELQKQIKNAELTTDINKSNKAQLLSGLIQKADAYLKRYSAELQKFQAQFTKASNVAQLNQQGELAKLKGEIDIQTGKANEKMLIFKTAVEKLFEQAKIDLQRQLQLSSLTTDYSQKNAVAQYQQTVSSNEAAIKAFSVDLEQWVQTQNLKFGKFKTTIELYLSDNQSIIQEFQAKVQKDMALITSNIQNSENEKQKLTLLQKSLSEQFNQFVMLMFPRQQAQPQQEGQ